MAKGVDPFEKFKAATLSSPSLSDAIKPTAPAAPAQEEQAVSPASAPVQEPAAKPVTPAKPEKPALEQVSFFIDKELKKAVGLLKYEQGVQLKDLYEEAIRDLLKKYNKL